METIMRSFFVKLNKSGLPRQLSIPTNGADWEAEDFQAPRPRLRNPQNKPLETDIPEHGDRIYVWTNYDGAGLTAVGKIKTITENSEGIAFLLSDVELLGPPYLQFQSDKESRTINRGNFKEHADGFLLSAHKDRRVKSWQLSEDDISYITSVLRRSSNWNDAARDALDDIAVAESDIKDLPETERTALIKARIGQGIFRENLLSYWNGCAVLGDLPHYCLRASHIKPWRDCSNKERLDHFNGLLLSPNLDHFFDAGLIGFDDRQILRSPRLDAATAERLSIRGNLTLRKLDDRHKAYLAWHRKEVFK
jgi:hypothetical protein